MENQPCLKYQPIQLHSCLTHIYMYSASHMIYICNIIKALWIVKYDICWNHTQSVHEETFLTEMLHYFQKAVQLEPLEIAT